MRINPEFTQVGDRIIASAPWAASEGRDVERFLVLTVRGDKIVDMQGFESRNEAARFAKGR